MGVFRSCLYFTGAFVCEAISPFPWLPFKVLVPFPCYGVFLFLHLHPHKCQIQNEVILCPGSWTRPVVAPEMHEKPWIYTFVQRQCTSLMHRQQNSKVLKARSREAILLQGFSLFPCISLVGFLPCTEERKQPGNRGRDAVLSPLANGTAWVQNTWFQGDEQGFKWDWVSTRTLVGHQGPIPISSNQSLEGASEQSKPKSAYSLVFLSICLYSSAHFQESTSQLF